MVKSQQQRGKRGSKQEAKTFRYASYNFVDKDPVIDLLRTAVQDSGMTRTAIAARSVSVSTLSNWFDKGTTKRPQFASINAVARTIGMEFRLVPMEKKP